MELVFELGSPDVADVARRIISVLGLEDEIIRLYGKPVSSVGIAEIIRGARRNAFSIETSKCSVHFATAAAYKLHLLEIREGTGCEMHLWDIIADLFIGESGFVQAYVADDEYAYWQSAHDPVQYEAAGRTISGLPMISNGLPAPLARMVIDVSGNPSRRVLRVGFVEAIGHILWLGSKFWAAVGERRQQEIFRLKICQAIVLIKDVLRVQVLAGPFIDEKTRFEQEQLRKVLFE